MKSEGAESMETEGAEPMETEQSREDFALLLSRVSYARDYWLPTFSKGREDRAFYSNHRLQVDALTRGEEAESSVPQIRTPLLEKYVNMIVNTILASDVEPVLVPRNSTGGDAMSDRMTTAKYAALLRQVKRESDFTMAISKSSRDALIGGMGMLSLTIEKAQAGVNEHHIVLNSVPDPFHVAVDPTYANEGFRRIDWAISMKMMPIGMIREQWEAHLTEEGKKLLETTSALGPDGKGGAVGHPVSGIAGGGTGDAMAIFCDLFGIRQDATYPAHDKDRPTYRTFYEHWEMEEDTCHVVSLNGVMLYRAWGDAPGLEKELEAIREQSPKAVITEEMCPRPRRRLFLGTRAISAWVSWEGDRIPYFPICTAAEYTEAGLTESSGISSTGMYERWHKSFIHGQKDAQRNANATLAYHRKIMELTIDPIILASGDQNGNQKQQVRDGDRFISAGPGDKMDVVNPGAGIQGPLLQGLMAMGETIERSTGLHDSLFGEALPRQTSGRAVAQYQSAGQKNIEHWTRIVRRAMRAAIQEVVQMLPRVYTQPMYLRIQKTPGAPEESVALNMNVMDKDGSKDAFQSLGVGRYDVDLRMVPHSESLGDQKMQEAMELINTSAPEHRMMLMPDMLEAIGTPGAELAARRMRASLPRHLLTEEEKKEVLETFGEPGPSAEQQAEQQKMELEMARLQLEAKKAGADELKTLSDSTAMLGKALKEMGSGEVDKAVNADTINKVSRLAAEMLKLTTSKTEQFRRNSEEQ